MLEEDLEIFQKHANFDVESLDTEVIRKQIKIDLLQQMLAVKPHYAKHFTELEEEIEDRQAFIDFKMGQMRQRNRRSIFNSTEIEECTELDNTYQGDSASIQF